MKECVQCTIQAPGDAFFVHSGVDNGSPCATHVWVVGVPQGGPLAARGLGRLVTIEKGVECFLEYLVGVVLLRGGVRGVGVGGFGC